MHVAGIWGLNESMPAPWCRSSAESGAKVHFGLKVTPHISIKRVCVYAHDAWTYFDMFLSEVAFVNFLLEQLELPQMFWVAVESGC